MANTIKAKAIMDVEKKTVKTYGELTQEVKDKIHNDVLEHTSKPKKDTNRKSKAIAQNKEVPNKDTKACAEAVTGLSQREIEYGEKHPLFRTFPSKDGKKTFKFIYKGYLFSDLNVILVSNVSVRQGILGLSEIACNGDIFHKLSNKVIDKENASSIITDMFLEDTRATTDMLCEPIINWKSDNKAYGNFLSLKATIIVAINEHGSKDFRLIDANNMSDFEKRLHSVAQSIEAKAKNFSDSIATTEKTA